MKCGNCRLAIHLGEPYANGTVQCSITGKITSADTKCDPVEVRRAKMARINTDKTKAADTLKELRDKFFYKKLDVRYVYDTLAKLAIKTDLVELVEVLDYLEEFL